MAETTSSAIDNSVEGLLAVIQAHCETPENRNMLAHIPAYLKDLISQYPPPSAYFRVQATAAVLGCPRTL